MSEATELIKELSDSDKEMGMPKDEQKRTPLHLGIESIARDPREVKMLVLCQKLSLEE